VNRYQPRLAGNRRQAQAAEPQEGTPGHRGTIINSMRKLSSVVGLAAAAVVVFSAAASAQYGAGWTIPAGAPTEKSPLKPGPDVLKRGKGTFDSRCSKCHGATGVGNGPDSDAQNPAADLTDAFRADLNPDGVMYYRVWNGKPPAMPAFKSQLTRDEVWAVVEYAKSLRKAQ
jgi:mono/diheme cytochrome c family protein